MNMIQIMMTHRWMKIGFLEGPGYNLHDQPLRTGNVRQSTSAILFSTSAFDSWMYVIVMILSVTVEGRTDAPENTY
jgi:hypothetical protein